MSLSAPLQQVSVIPNKVDNDGHHYLKVLLLSNKPTKNNWIAPFKRIGDLPKSLLDSYMKVPFINKHDHELYDRLDSILKNSGLDREQRYQKLLQECDLLKSGYIDHIFLDNPDSTTLYGQLKVTDPEENKYIREHGGKETRIKFTSPAISGVYTEDESGLKTYDINTMKAFHLARVPIPAFDEDEAEVKGICFNGNSESCREALAYAGTEPSENVNNTCGCNKNIMSDITTSKVEKIADIPSNQGPIPTGEANTTTVFKEQPKVNYKIEEPVSDAPKAEINKQKDSGEIFKSQKEIDAEKREAELQDTIKKLKKQSEEQNNFYLEELLSTHIPRDNFKKDEEYDSEKTNLKNFILKYNVSLEDAKWFIKKSVPKVVEVEKKKGEQNQYAGFERRNTYNSDQVIKPVSAPKESGNDSVQKDVPILF
jgi:hypothetical protein